MKKTIYIVSSMKKFNDEVNRKFKAGLLDDNPMIGHVMTSETFHQIFTPERIRLLQRIHKNKIQNIYQIAKDLGKPYEVVFRNIKYLEGLDFIRITTKNRKKIPTLKGKFTFEFFPEEAEA